MRQVSQLSPELASGVLQLARALLAAARNWTFYPGEHPAVGESIAQLAEAVRQTSLRSNRPYRQGLATERIRAIMGEQGSPAFNQTLLRRFVNLVGLFPVDNLVRLSAEELAVVTAVHPSDPFRRQVKIISNALGEVIEQPAPVDTWERDSRGEHLRAVVEAVDPEPLGIDPLPYL